ncbi:MAG: hypothetical protein IT564_12750, partial [Rhodospirillales bacterium]|nr:hypothetical protein [Rhodospirillales bacterium]
DYRAYEGYVPVGPPTTDESAAIVAAKNAARAYAKAHGGCVECIDTPFDRVGIPQNNDEGEEIQPMCFVVQ